MNNFEKIQTMTIDELADLLASTKPKACGFCMGTFTGCLREVSCKSAIKDWLNSNRPPQYLDNKEEQKQ